MNAISPTLSLTLCLLSCLSMAETKIVSDAMTLTINAQGGVQQALLHSSGEVAAFNSAVPLFAVATSDSASKELIIPLTAVRQENDGRLIAQSADGARRATFARSSSPRHLALRLTSIHGITPGKERLRIALHGASKTRRWRAIELDWMAEIRDFTSGFECELKYLDHTAAPENLGGIAIYTATSDAEEDEILLNLWVDEKLPHPRIEGDWTVNRAREWLEDWQSRFADRSQIILEGQSLDELRAGLVYAERMQAKEVYLFTQTWRTDGFWPTRNGHVHVRRELFPRGEDDLRSFSDELAARGMRLNLHYVSGGIGKLDERRIGTKPDRRLASWMTGTVVSDIAADARTIAILPAKPIIWTEGEKHGSLQPAELPNFFNFNILRLEDELIEVGSFATTAEGHLQLNQCRRGVLGTSKAVHTKASDVAGLIVAYNVNYVPDNSSTLLEEMAREFAEFLERSRISHVEYDGSEIHAYNGAWGYRKYATLVYQNLSRPVTAHDSRGSKPPCHFEYRFHSTRKLMRGACSFTHGGWNAPVQLDSPSRAATRELDAHFFLSQGHYGGALGLCRPEPLFAVSASMLKEFGLTATMIQAVLDWKEVSRRMTEEQHQKLEETFLKPAPGMPERSRHRESHVVHTIRKTGEEYELVPIRVMSRKTGDIAWQLGQEHGPLGPRQFVKLGESLDLINSDSPQVPSFIIRVLPGFAPDRGAEPRTVGNENAEALKPNATPDLFTAGNNQAPSIEREKKTNLSLMPESRVIQPRGNSSLTASKSELILSGSNKGDSALWECNEFPGWRIPIDMQGRRGIGLEIDGDGSGAVLLIQVAGHGARDYAVPIDFHGKRWVEIPNGEVAWACSYWGWRMQTKHCEYGKLNEVRLGFGKFPPRTEARITIGRLQALAEIPATVSNPTVSIGERRFSMKGTVSSGEHIHYQGGRSATVCDANWNKLREMAVEGGGDIPTGTVGVQIEGKSSGVEPWLEVQITTQGQPIKVGNSKP